MEHVKVVAKTIIDWFTEDNKEYRKTVTGEEFISGGRVQTKPDILAKCYDLPNYCWSLCSQFGGLLVPNLEISESQYFLDHPVSNLIILYILYKMQASPIGYTVFS